MLNFEIKSVIKIELYGGHMIFPDTVKGRQDLIAELVKIIECSYKALRSSINHERFFAITEEWRVMHRGLIEIIYTLKTHWSQPDSLDINVLLSQFISSFIKLFVGNSRSLCMNFVFDKILCFLSAAQIELDQFFSEEEIHYLRKIDPGFAKNGFLEQEFTNLIMSWQRESLDKNFIMDDANERKQHYDNLGLFD